MAARGRAEPSGNRMTNHDAAIAEAMIKRGDRDHDVAAWFGLNSGRIGDLKKGLYGPLPPADPKEMPPSGSPGPKAKRLRRTVEKAHAALVSGDAAQAEELLVRAMERFDENE